MKSIRSKLFTTFTALILVIFLLFGVGMTVFVRTFYLETVRVRLVEEARVAGELIKPILSDYPEKTDAEEIKRFVELLGVQTNARITLVAPDGTVLGDTFHDAALMDNHLNRPEIRAAAQGLLVSSIRYSHTVDLDMLYTAVSLDHNEQRIGFLRIALSLAQLNSAILRVQYGLLAAMLLFLSLTVAVTLKLSSGLTRPLEQIAGVAQQITQGELTSRLYIYNRDETGKLATAINQMADSLQEQVKTITAGKERLETLLLTMVEGIIVFDSDARVVMINPAAKKMLDLTDTDWPGRRSIEIIRSIDLQEKIDRVNSEKVFLEHEITIFFPDRKVLSVTLVPIYSKNLENEVVLAVFHDITRLRRLEEIRTDFAANVSHELRTPLTAIQGFAETLLEGACDDPTSARRFAEIIDREARRLNVLIEDVLKLSQIESGRTSIIRKAVDVDKLVAGVIERLGKKAHGHKIKLKIPDNLSPIAGDEGLLVQALFNLLDNAVKYTQAGGTITVSADSKEGQVRLSVSDNGIGIPKEAQDRIFERFYRVDRARTRRLGGTGLGLAIVKHIVEAHQGQLEMESEEGKGTTVTVTIPYYTD